MDIPREVVGRDPWAYRPRIPEPEEEEAPTLEVDVQTVEVDVSTLEYDVPPAEAPITDAEFEEMIEEALESIPPELSSLVENCAFIVEREPRPGRNILGLYHGRPLTTRQEYSGALPDTITIFQGPLMRHYPQREELRRQVRKTVIHEIGHYFGFEERELHELGWG